MANIPRCSLLDVAALILPVWLFILVSHTAADADLWGHLRFGSDLLAGYGLPSADPYSFTSDVPWINHEWLSEAAMAAAFTAAGAIGLNLLKLAVIAGIGALVWRKAIHARASTGSAALLTTLVLFASYTRTQVLRPQLFSVLVFAVLLDLLQRSAEDARQRWIGLPILFCVWANLHGAWIVGFAVLCTWVGAEAVQKRTLGTALRGLVLLLAVAAATTLNPYGFAQWSFLRSTVGLSRADISDWAPLLRLPTAIIILDSMLLAIAIAASVVCRRRPAPRDAAVVALLAFGMFRVGRVDAFLQVAIGLLFAPVIVDAFNRVGARLARFERLTSRSRVNTLAASAAVLVAMTAAAPQVTRIVVEGPWIPDMEAVRFLRSESRHTRLLTWFDWGEYAIWHLAPAGVQVSMDGRRETVYSTRVLDDHWAFYRNAGAAWQYPDQIRADRIWLPRELPVVAALREHGWHVAFESDRSIVLSREPSRTLVVASSRDTSPQLFPGE